MATQFNSQLSICEAFVSSHVLQDLPMDSGALPQAAVGLWTEGTYRRIDIGLRTCKMAFRAQQEYLRQLIQTQSPNNMKERLDTVTTLQGLTKDLAELTTLKARLRLWELLREDGPASGQGRRSQS